MELHRNRPGEILDDVLEARWPHAANHGGAVLLGKGGGLEEFNKADISGIVATDSRMGQSRYQYAVSMLKVELTSRVTPEMGIPRREEYTVGIDVSIVSQSWALSSEKDGSASIIGTFKLPQESEVEFLVAAGAASPARKMALTGGLVKTTSEPM